MQVACTFPASLHWHSLLWEHRMESLSPIVLNLVYCAIGGLMLMLFSYLGTKLFSHLVKFKIGEQLAKGNVAVGLALMGIFIGMGIGLGLVIGMALN